MFNSEEINTFLAVIKSGNLLQAADLVCATQSTVSYRINNLEQKLGKKLLIRTQGGKKISLTADGKRFADIAERWKDVERDALQMKNSNRISLSVGAADVLALYLLPDFFQAISTRCAIEERYNFSIETGRYWALLERLRLGHIAVAFTLVPSSHPDIFSTKITSSRLKIAVMPDSAIRSVSTLTFNELDPAKEIYIPYSSDIDLWRESRGLSKHPDNIEKNHLLAPVMKSPGRWAFIPDFMEKDLVQHTGCTILDTISSQAPAINVYKSYKQDVIESHCDEFEVIENLLAKTLTPT